jgi:hypothetical protein
MWSLSNALRGAALRCQVSYAITVCLILAFAGTAQAAEGARAAQAAGATDTPTTSWGGIGWGIGIASDFDLGGQRITGTPQIIGTPGIVRVDNTSANVNVGFVLEAHYFFRDWALPTTMNGCTNPSGPNTYSCTDAATGPFVAIEVGGGTKSTPDAAGLITGYAMGWMVGFRHLNVSNGRVTNANSTSSWNFGIGLRVDPQAKVLGDGFVANMPPPAGETSVRVKTEPRYGVMLLSSFSF